jgi:hypothetical protein
LTTNVTPQTASDVVGGQITMFANFVNQTSLQWQKNGTNISGATSPTLTLNNLQLADTAGYSLLASNAAGAVSSAACVVTVNPVPAPVNNAIVAFAAQTMAANSFTPTWDSSSLTSSLIFGASPSSSGIGDFTALFNNEGASLPSVLTDGTFGTVDFGNTGNHAIFTCIGSDTNTGNFVIYTLTGSANGYDITNIMSSGGWNDQGRDQQAYTVSYSIVAAPTNFISLAVVNYNPVNPDGVSVDRVTITPSTGALAHNVAALKFDMTSPSGENGYSGYSEISVFGLASGSLVVSPSVGSVTKSGNDLIVTGTGGFPPNSAYTWLATTNLTPPVIWTTNGTGTLDDTGAFSNSIPINSSQSVGFFRLRIP